MSQQPRRLGLVAGAGAELLPPDRGPLWYDHQIADQFLGGLPGITNKVRWIRQHLPKSLGIRFGRQTAWYETDIRAWLEEQRSGRRKSA